MKLNSILKIIPYILCLSLVAGAAFAAEQPYDFNKVPAESAVTMIDLGAKRMYSLQDDDADHGKDGKGLQR